MTTEEPGASSIVRHIYHEHVARFGEPDEGISLDRSSIPAPDTMPARADVLVWYPTPEVDIVTFATIGMCEKPMADADHRAELHFGVRRQLEPDEVEACAVFLANLSTIRFTMARISIGGTS